jgi:hypothetical protein
MLRQRNDVIVTVQGGVRRELQGEIDGISNRVVYDRNKRVRNTDDKSTKKRRHKSLQRGRPALAIVTE